MKGAVITQKRVVKTPYAFWKKQSYLVRDKTQLVQSRSCCECLSDGWEQEALWEGGPSFLPPSSRGVQRGTANEAGTPL